VNGWRLREARQSTKLTLRELARRSGVDQRTISDIELGRNQNPSYEKVVRLARALAMTADELWPVPFEDGQPDPSLSHSAAAS
jgi:transcriptional regulator with XRE-family HTH domain